MSNISITEQFKRTRAVSEEICRSLALELFSLQPKDFTSPPKWHLAHATWFFEEFILRQFSESYRPLDDQYRVFFNSYYKSQGDHWPRDARGKLERPTPEEVIDYRRYVDAHILRLVANHSNSDILNRLVLGIHHEQQHQELLLMDIKCILSQIQDSGPYSTRGSRQLEAVPELKFIQQSDGLIEIGQSPSGDFCFDNETPRFKHFQYPFALANRPVTNGDFLEFIQDGGYSNPLLWKSDGWDYINSHKEFSPLYWRNDSDQWLEFTLQGEAPLNLHSPVCHISYYEADAFAEWAGARIPTEFELELVYQSQLKSENGFLESNQFHPFLFNSSNEFLSLTGNLWEWTGSAYLPYPGYRRPAGAFGEYNQKFMVNQMVLKGGSIGTPKSHFRPSYRNFFYPHQRWAFTGFRLAKDLI